LSGYLLKGKRKVNITKKKGCEKEAKQNVLINFNNGKGFRKKKNDHENENDTPK